FSFSFSPIRIETGGVGGVFTAVMETTEKVIGERRLQILRDLAASADAQTEQDACRIAAETFGHNLHDIPFSVLCEVGAEKRIQILCTAGIDSENILCRSLQNAGSALHKHVLQTAHSNEILELHDLEGLRNDFPHGPWQLAVQTLLLLPIAERGQSRASKVLLAAVSPHKRLDDSYRTFFQLVARQIGTNLADARSRSEERRRAEALAELDRAKTLFFSNVSHEFRTPLTLLLGPLEDSLAVGNGLGGEQRERLELAHRNSLRLLKLVNTLLDFSRIEAGRIQASYQPTDLSSFTAELASMFQSATDRANLKLIINCRQIADPVYVDRDMWEKIVLNLLSNAFKFTFEGEIEVSLQGTGRAVELTVRDTGTGIPPQDVPHLFERFYRVKNARGRTFEGTGIGLSLVQELAKLHGGTVRVASNVSQGSTFVVSVPFGKDHLPADRVGAASVLEPIGMRGQAYVQEAMRWLPGAEAAADDLELGPVVPSEERVPGPAGASGTRAYILLADDNADMREYLQRLLHSYEVRAVVDGEAAVSSAHQRRPDLILADIMMPKLDGFGLLRAVRQDEGLKDVPVILLSARAGEESRVEGLDAGADDYLVKPFSARELLARVRSHLMMARMRSERTEVERALRLDSELLAAIVASSDDAIVSKNLEGIITSWNKGAERIFGYSVEEAVGQHITLIIPEDRRDEENEILARLRRGERIDHFDTVRRRKDGTLLDVSLTISPLRDPAGRIVGASKVARDVSLQKRIDQALRQSEENYRKLAEELELQVRARTRELEQRNAEVLIQSEQLRELSWQMLQIQDQERRHIARELHDSAGQTLTVLGMNLSMLVQSSAREAPGLANEAEKIQELVQQLHREIRTASYLLHPPLLDESGLSSALRWYIEGLVERSGLGITLEISEDFGRIPSEMELMIFRLVQECLTNIHRHSGSKTALIRISRDAEAISVQIEDQGKGLPPEKLRAIQSGGSGVGIRGMRERLRQFHGQLNIDSDSSGTRISVSIPVPNADQHDGVEPLQAAV
ncbi:MAG TPA: ATP-binding protein, partial [Terriglobales bacterium]|nr:ATP-binding protein [Terriglobales bacterium]